MVAIALLNAPIAASAPVEEVCPNGRAPRAGVCPDTNGAPGAFPGGGGADPGGGLLGAIRDAIGGLTGGLL